MIQPEIAIVDLDREEVARGLQDGSILLVTTDPWELPSRPLDGVGEICGRAVACVTAEAQRVMHRGYDVPARHREDLLRLDRS